MLELRIILLFFVTANLAVGQQTISLASNWRFQMDSNDVGIAEKWFSKKLSDNIELPGSMLERGKGNEVTLQTKWTGSIYDSSWFFNPRYAKYRQPGNLKFPFWLTPDKYYVGAAWYQKEVVIPLNWKDQNIRLFLERCHTETKVWIDDKEAGIQNSMVAPHDYDLTSYMLRTPFISPGKHTITICVDNRIKDINVGPDSHSLTDHTQGNWNGIVGKMELRCSPEVQISSFQAYPDASKKSVIVKLEFTRAYSTPKILTLTAAPFNAPQASYIKPVIVTTNLLDKPFLLHNSPFTLDVKIPLGNDALLWDEFNPVLYKLTASLTSTDNSQKKERNFKQELQTQFGLRDFTVKGTQFQVNGRNTFLRGTVENCVFPLTGYASMKEVDWERIFRICKSYGLNHMRFHSYCPPEAAFDAADRVGFYLQPEGPSWANHGSSLGDGKPIDQFIYDETNRMMQVYGNHPSYCMLAYGNEPRGGHQVEYLTNFIHYWENKDNRRLYTGASVAMSWPLVPANEYMIKSGARNLSWNKLPESQSDYTSAISTFKVPYVAHEMGQWCVFPNFDEIKKYIGPYKDKNFELFQEDLKDQGMSNEAQKFLMASGYLQVLCYKNEIEKSLRTPNNGGFQLLSLNDYPGQGTALVGMLNAFWDEKGYTNASQFSRFCNSTVPLLRLPKFVFTQNDSVNGQLEIYHYGPSDFKDASVYWRVKDERGKTIYESKFTNQNIPIGKNTIIGNINYLTNTFNKATKLTIEAGIEGTNYANDWNVWIYPKQLINNENLFDDNHSFDIQKDIYYTDTLGVTAERILADGGKVLLFGAGKVVKGKEIFQSFTPVFWNTSWFKMRPPHTLGFLVKSESALFNSFPTENHIDLQWWDVVKGAQVMHLEDFPKGFQPLVQPIDTWFLNRRLAMLFEAKVGKGKIIVTSLDLFVNLKDRPASSQLLHSIGWYMNSIKFNPTETIDVNIIRDLFRAPSKYVFDAYTKDSPDELKTAPQIRK